MSTYDFGITFSKMEDKLEEGEEEVTPEIELAIKNIAVKEGYVNYEVKTKKINTAGANLIGVLFEVNLKGETKNGNEEINFFVKKCIGDDVLGKFLQASSVYETESFVYNELVKYFDEMQDSANIPEEERYKTAKSYESPKSTIVILENLVKKGFKTPHRMDVVSLEYAKSSVKQLAKFHALSFVLEKKHPDFFESKLRNRKFPVNDNETVKASWNNLINMTVKGLPEDYKLKVENIRAVFYERMNKYLRAERFQITTLCHGDFRPSNVMVKEINGEIVEVLPIDYQCVYFGCPVIDFLFFMACGTDRKFRIDHLEDLKTLYHDTLSDFMKHFNIDAEYIFPRTKMEEILNDCADYIPMVAVTGFPIIFAPENAIDTTEESIMEADLTLNARYKERLMEILDDFPVV